MKNVLPIIMDIEASGFGKNSYPIEVGIALQDGSTCCFLIKPAPNWQHWDLEGERLHGITRECLQLHGRDIENASIALNDLLNGKTVYCDGWAHDYTWLHVLYESAGHLLRFKLESLARLLDPAQMASWSKLKQQVEQECQFKRHRASNDALLIQRTYSLVMASRQ